MSLFLLLVVLNCFILGVVEAANITTNDWNVLKSFFSVANCKTEFCNALSNNQTCLLPIVCDASGNVLQLQLNNYNLSGSLMTEIAQLKQLQSVVLSNNAFNSTIPSELAQLSQLTLLDLSNNHFTGTVPPEFDRLLVDTIFVHGNRLKGVVPFFPRATKCSLQTGNGNDFCCPKGGENQPCCMPSTCFCSKLAPCTRLAPMPNRCFLENARYPDGIDNALCMTESTLDDEVDLRLGDYDTRVNFSVTLMNDFTVAFWAMAREKLASSEVATTAINGFMEGSASGGLFFPLKIASIDSSRLGIGFFLGTDGFTVFQHSSGTRAPIVVQRQSLIGWHHYSIVAAKRELFVYVDGISEPIAQSANPNAALLGFRLAFGRTRFYYSIGSPTGFEGWISELRLANRSMHGSEAMKQINNQSAWDFSYSMKGCSGENHAGTEIDRFKLQQAWLVCKEPLPTCGVSGGDFVESESVGCLCEMDNHEQQCVTGIGSLDSGVVLTNAKPIGLWRFDDETSPLVIDHSGNGYHGRWIGNRGIVMSSNASDGSPTKFTRFTGGFVDFGDMDAFDFGTRDFSAEMWIRYNKTNTQHQFLLSKPDSCPTCSNHWHWYLTWHYDGCAIGITEDATCLNTAGFNALVAIDYRWHHFRLTRRSFVLEFAVDGIVINTQTTSNIASLNNSMPLVFGAFNCRGPVEHFFLGDVANISFYVGKLPGQLCSPDTKAGNFSASSYLRSLGCQRVMGFCSPNNRGRQCCGVSGCAECRDYQSCSRNFTMLTTFLTTSTTSPTMSNLSTALAVTTLSGTMDQTTAEITISSSFTTQEVMSSPVGIGATSIAVVVLAVALFVLIGLIIVYAICRRQNAQKPKDMVLSSNTAPMTNVADRNEFNSFRVAGDSKQYVDLSLVPQKQSSTYYTEIVPSKQSSMAVYDDTEWLDDPGLQRENATVNDVKQ